MPRSGIRSKTLACPNFQSSDAVLLLGLQTCGKYLLTATNTTGKVMGIKTETEDKLSTYKGI